MSLSSLTYELFIIIHKILYLYLISITVVGFIPAQKSLMRSVPQTVNKVPD